MCIFFSNVPCMKHAHSNCIMIDCRVLANRSDLPQHVREKFEMDRQLFTPYNPFVCCIYCAMKPANDAGAENIELRQTLVSRQSFRGGGGVQRDIDSDSSDSLVALSDDDEEDDSARQPNSCPNCDYTGRDQVKF